MEAREDRDPNQCGECYGTGRSYSTNPNDPFCGYCNGTGIASNPNYRAAIVAFYAAVVVLIIVWFVYRVIQGLTH